MNLKQVVLIAAIAATSSGYADITIVQKVVSPTPAGGQPRQSTVTQSIKGSKMRIDMDEMTSSLVDLDAGKMYMLNHADKKIMAMPLDAMKNRAEQMQAVLAAGKTPESKVTPTGKTQTIAGLECKEYKVVTTGGMSVEATYWMAEDAKVAELDPFKKIIADMNPMLGKDVFSKLQGLPMRSETSMQAVAQKIVATTEVISISHDSLPDAQFNVPADYTLENFDLKGAGH